MRNLPNTTGLISDSKTPGETGDLAASFTGKDFYKDLIRKADSVPITLVFKHYGLRLDENNRKIVCPFKSHKGGRENSASFLYYPQTNTFWCFGCKVGIGCCDFVAAMDSLTKSKAASKILETFSADVSEDGELLDRQSFSEKLEIMIDFSTTIREFRQANLDEKSQDFIENICSVYDTINGKHKNLSNEALREIVQQLKEKITSYTICHTL